MRPGLSILVMLTVACARAGVPTTTTPATTPTTTTTQATTMTTSPSTTTTRATTSTRAAEVIEIEVEVNDGTSSLAGQRVAVEVGEAVVIRVRSDIADEVHLHGYDLFVDVAAGGQAELRLVADVPGVFEVELEEAHLLLFQLEVAP